MFLHRLLSIVTVFFLTTTLSGRFGLDATKANTVLTPERMLTESDKLINDLDSAALKSSPIASLNGQQEETLDYQTSSCRLVRIVHLLKHPGCQPKAIASFACSGSCPSYVKTSASSFYHQERSCSCCRKTSSQEATFTLDCPSLDPPYRKVKTHAPVDCLCRSCTDLSRENLRAQEFVDALSRELSSEA